MNWKSFVGSIVYFFMNLLLIRVFVPSYDLELMNNLAVLYVCIICITLSPIGEWVLCLLASAKPIPRKDMNIKIVPLLEIVLRAAKKEMPPMINTVRLRYIDDPAPMAYALGRKTICVTEGFLRLPDKLIMGALAHEVAHLAYRHTTVQLLIGGGNLFVTGFIFLLKLALKLFTLISGLSILKRNSRITGIIMAVCSAVLHFLVSAWTKLSMVFLCWSQRENEFIADSFAYEIGFGNELAAVLDKLQAPQKSTLIHALFSAHPSINERIGRLQELGATYSSY